MRDALDTRDNGLNLVRLVLAALVIVCHTWQVGGFLGPAFVGALGPWAVNGFFALSGYLIAGSRLRAGFGAFMLRRAARVLPGFWICLLVTAFAVTPLIAVFLGTGYDPGAAWVFVRGNWWLWYTQASVGDTLSAAPFPVTINGSLWTLGYEFSAYIVAGVLLGSAMFRERRAVSTALVFVALTGAHVLLTSEGLSAPFVMTTLRFGGFFAAGMLLHALGERIRVDWRVAAGSAAAVVIFSLVVPSVALLALPMAYLMLWCGAVVPLRWGAVNDYSYGVYIYAFPAQQLLAAAGVTRFGTLVFALLSMVTVAPVAALSWWLVERPALRLVRRHSRVAPLGEGFHPSRLPKALFVWLERRRTIAPSNRWGDL